VAIYTTGIFLFQCNTVFTKTVQRIFKYDESRYTNLTLDNNQHFNISKHLSMS